MDVAIGLALVGATLLLAAPELSYPGYAQDEGIMLIGPDRMLHGAIPHRDFQTLYGPAPFWVLAAVFAAVGPSLLAERAVGLAYHVAIVLAVFKLTRPLGLSLSAWAGLVVLGFVSAIGLGAFAWVGGFASALWSLAIAARRDTGRSAGLVAGALGGVAVLFRIELAVVLPLAALPFLIGRSRLARWFMAGMMLGLLALVGHILVVSPDVFVSRVIASGLAITQAARLPLPPKDAMDVGLFWLVVVSASVALIGGLASVATTPRDPQWRVRLALGVLAASLLPNLLQRADQFHALYIGAIAVPLLGPSIVFGLRMLRLSRVAVISALITSWLALAFLAPYVVLSFARDAARATGALEPQQAYWVEHNGRSFPLESPRSVAEASAVLKAADAVPPGRLIVGPVDLSRTYYTDTYLYFLLPEMTPATYFLEMTVGSANASGSPLAGELQSADILILTNRYDAGYELWTSGGPGDRRASDVVERCFVVRWAEGPYRLLTRRADATARGCAQFTAMSGLELLRPESASE